MSQFCNSKMAMSMGMNGFTFGPHGQSDDCFIFLFKDWVVDSPVKYAAVLIGVFVWGVINELLREAKSMPMMASVIKSDVWSSVYLAFQMGMSYTLMLLVMLFDFWVLFATCAGLGVGHYLGRQSRRLRRNAKTNRDENLPLLGSAHDASSIDASTNRILTERDRKSISQSPNTTFNVNVYEDNGDTDDSDDVSPDTTPCCRV
mmetsp:Transcript_18826/g.49011  ORF Transcript_18826/g.49011 Transcript_18826/m.49011 type:complete len:203 (+) Transcript_18826:521-1129(+)